MFEALSSVVQSFFTGPEFTVPTLWVAFGCKLVGICFQHNDGTYLTLKNLICFGRLLSNSIIVRLKSLSQ
jgi:hypothetical protein